MTSYFVGALPRLVRLRRSASTLVFDADDEAHSSSTGDGDRVLKGVAEAMSPFELRRVGNDFKAMDLDYTEQVRASICVYEAEHCYWRRMARFACVVVVSRRCGTNLLCGLWAAR